MGQVDQFTAILNIRAQVEGIPQVESALARLRKAIADASQNQVPLTPGVDSHIKKILTLSDAYGQLASATALIDPDALKFSGAVKALPALQAATTQLGLQLRLVKDINDQWQAIAATSKGKALPASVGPAAGASDPGFRRVGQAWPDPNLAAGEALERLIMPRLIRSLSSGFDTVARRIEQQVAIASTDRSAISAGDPVAILAATQRNVVAPARVALGRDTAFERDARAITRDAVAGFFGELRARDAASGRSGVGASSIINWLQKLAVPGSDFYKTGSVNLNALTPQKLGFDKAQIYSGEADKIIGNQLAELNWLLTGRDSVDLSALRQNGGGFPVMPGGFASLGQPDPTNYFPQGVGPGDGRALYQRAIEYRNAIREWSNLGKEGLPALPRGFEQRAIAGRSQAQNERAAWAEYVAAGGVITQIPKKFARTGEPGETGQIERLGAYLRGEFDDSLRRVYGEKRAPISTLAGVPRPLEPEPRPGSQRAYALGLRQELEMGALDEALGMVGRGRSQSDVQAMLNRAGLTDPNRLGDILGTQNVEPYVPKNPLLRIDAAAVTVTAGVANVQSPAFGGSGALPNPPGSGGRLPPGGGRPALPAGGTPEEPFYYSEALVQAQARELARVRAANAQKAKEAAQLALDQAYTPPQTKEEILARVSGASPSENARLYQQVRSGAVNVEQLGLTREEFIPLQRALEVGEAETKKQEEAQRRETKAAQDSATARENATRSLRESFNRTATLLRSSEQALSGMARGPITGPNDAAARQNVLDRVQTRLNTAEDTLNRVARQGGLLQQSGLTPQSRISLGPGQAAEPIEQIMARLGGSMRAAASAGQVLNGETQRLGGAWASTSTKFQQAQESFARQQSGAAGGGQPPPGGPTYGAGFSAAGNPNNRTPGMIGDFERGFRGRGERPYAEQIGQAFKFSLFYGTAYQLLFQITQTLSTALQQSIEFEKSFVELNIAMGDGAENTRDLANSLGDIAASAGFAGSEGVLAGARAIGLFDLRQQPQEVQEAGAAANVRVVAQTSFATGQEFQTIQRNLGAIAQAFGGGYESLTRFQDLDAFLTKANGLVTGSTFETVAQVGSLGKEAGFNEEEIFSLAAKLQSRTGQTPAAVAGLLSQFFGRAGDPGLRSKLGGVGIDTSQTYRDQIEQLSQKELTPALRNLILNSFGRGRSGQAASIIVTGFEGITADASAARTGSAGMGQQQFDERMRSIGGELARFIGAMKDLARDLADTGLLDLFGYLVVGVTRLVEAVDGVIEVFNILPRPVRDVIFALSALALASKFAIPALQTRAGYGITNIGTGRTTSLFRAGAVPSAVDAAALGRYGITGVAQGAIAPAVLPAGRFAGLKVAGGAAMAALGGPVGLTILGLTGLAAAAGAAKNKLDEVAEADKVAVDARRTFTGAATVDEFRTAASSLGAAADTLGKTNDGFFGAIIAGSRPDRDAAQLESNAAYANEMADRLEAEDRLAAAMAETSVFGDSASRTSEDIAYGFELLALQGASAKEQLDLYTQAILENGNAAAAAAFQPVEFTAQTTKSLFGLQSDQEFQQLPGTRPAGQIGLPGTLGVGAVSPEKGGFQPPPVTVEDILRTADAEAASKAIEKQLSLTKVEDGLSDEEYRRIAEAGVGTFDLTGLVDPEAARTALVEMLVDKFKQQNLGDIIDNASYTREQGVAQLKQLLASQGADKPSSGTGTAGLLTKAQTDLDAILALQGKTEEGQGVGEFIYQVREAKTRLAEATIDDLDAVRRAAQNRATSEGEILAAGRVAVNGAIQAAVDAGDANLLVEIINDADAAAVAVARAAINRAREVALAAVRSARARLAAVYADAQQSGIFSDSRETNALGGVSGADAAAAARDKELADLEAGLARTMPVGTKDSTRLSGSDANRPKADTADDGPTAAQIAAARARAEAARTGGGVEEALAAIQTAQADMAAAEKNTVEFYSALAALYQAQQQLRDAVRQRQLTRALLTIDLTDPLQEASAELQSARAKLEEDRARGASSDVIEADALEVRRGEINVENTRWQQFLSDLQTNEQLKRITHRQYMDTLEAERQRLLAVAVRTRQQQDQLNEIEGLIQAANEAAAGQFNLGDINLPTPYQARRMVQGQLGLGGGGTTTVSNVNITVDGADTGFVLQVLGQYLGQPVIQSATTATRRV